MKQLTCNLFNVQNITEPMTHLIFSADPETGKPSGGHKGVLLRYTIWRQQMLEHKYHNDPAVEDAVAEVWGNYHLRKSNRRLKFSVVDVDA